MMCINKAEDVVCAEPVVVVCLDLLEVVQYFLFCEAFLELRLARLLVRREKRPVCGIDECISC